MLVVVATLAFKCGINQHDSCKAAYAKYLRCYPKKEFSSQKREIFCSRFSTLTSQNCASCDVTEIMDQEIGINTRLASRNTLEKKE